MIGSVNFDKLISDLEKLLILTFTNNAAKDIFSKIEEKLDKELQKEEFYIGTFHSIFYKILRENRGLLSKYFGIKNLRVIEEDEDIKMFVDILMINFYDSFNNGLNCNEGGHGNLGYKHSKESRKKMRDSHLGVKHSEERNKRKSERQKGKTRSLETKKKISETKIKNMNEITKNKIRIKLFGNKNGIGNKGAAKKIICTTTKEIFQSVKEAAIKLELHSSNIIKVCKNKQSHTGGFKFKYYE